MSNKDTLRKQWEEIMDKCYRDQSGQLPGKTIVFAMTQEHALRLQDVFDEMYPQFPNLVRVITHKSEYRGQLVTAASSMHDMPRIALSVDMLDTGIDVPEVINLVFMKPVQSRIKLEQMIGRGTRCHAACHFLERLPGGIKSEFLVIDFWENEFNKAPDEAQAQELPVLVALFNTRLRLLESYLGEQESQECKDLIASLREQIGRIPKESFSVRKVLPEIEEAFSDAFWGYLLPSKLDFLRLKVGPLLRLAPEVDVAAETFHHKIERLKLALRSGRDPAALVTSIVEDAASLPEFVILDDRLSSLVKGCTPNNLAQAKPAELSRIAAGLAPQMKYRRRVSSFLMLDLPDRIDLSGYILLTQSGEQVYVKEYRLRVEKRILAIVESHPALQAIGRGETPDDRLLLDLERTLQAGAGSQRPGADPAEHPPGVRRAGGELPGLPAPGAGAGRHPRLRRGGAAPVPAVHHPTRLRRRPDPLPAGGAVGVPAEAPPGAGRPVC